MDNKEIVEKVLNGMFSKEFLQSHDSISEATIKGITSACEETLILKDKEERTKFIRDYMISEQTNVCCILPLLSRREELGKEFEVKKRNKQGEIKVKRKW